MEKYQFIGFCLIGSFSTSDSQTGYSFSRLSNKFFSTTRHLFAAGQCNQCHLPILQLSESFSSNHQMHSEHDILLTLLKTYCIMLYLVFWKSLEVCRNYDN